MPATRDWGHFRAQVVALLERRTGRGLDEWLRAIRASNPPDEATLRRWLTEQGVEGYPKAMLVAERFGYPDFLTASAEELLAAQFKDRTALRAIYDAVIEAACGLEGVEVQARKTYVSLLTPRRTFARLRPTTRTRLDLGVRLPGARPAGRLHPSRIHASMTVELRFERLEEFDRDARDLLQRAYAANL